MKKILFLLWGIPYLSTAQTLVTNYNTGTSFACIAVDSNYNIWAGRNNGTGTGTNTGAYVLNKQANPAATQFIAVAGTTTDNIQALAADASQNVWVGHNGLGGTTSNSGGIERISINSGSIQHYSPDRNAECFTYLARDGLATLNCAGLAVDPQNGIWSAHKYHDLTVPPDYILTPGSFSFKPASSPKFFSKGTYQDYITAADPAELPYPAYTCNAPITQLPQPRNVYSVACGANQAWVSVAAYTGKNGASFPARILKYTLGGIYTNTSFSFASIGIPAGGYFNGLYVAPNGDVWVTMTAAKGFAVLRNGSWTYVSTSTGCIFPSTGTLINTNAIWGNKLGQVFIGTNQGLIVYRGTGAVNLASSYSLYTVANFGLLSNQILGGASEKDSIQWMATDNGIMRTKLGSNYPLSTQPFDYTMCTAPGIATAITNLENAITAPAALGRQDYHTYVVETQICDIAATTANHQNCNAQYVYRMMKNDPTLTAITPFDFPYDNLGPILLLTADKAALNAMVSQRVNAWDPGSILNVTNGNNGIKYIWQVLDASYALRNLANSANALLPFLPPYVNTITRYTLMDLQRSANPTTVQACATYYLYNSPNFIIDKALYKVVIDPFCGFGLESPIYDKVWIVPDDRNLTITNYTQPGHILFPGKIFRRVVEECGKVKIITTGTGLNYCGDNFRGRMNAVGNIIGGSILFKNVDERLKIAFKASR